MNWSSTYECHSPSRFWIRANFWSNWSGEKVLNALFNFVLKKYSCAVSWKVIFSLVKDLFKWIEVLRSSVIVLVGSNTELIFDQGGLGKKCLTRCQISSSIIFFHNLIKSDSQSSLSQTFWLSRKTNGLERRSANRRFPPNVKFLYRNSVSLDKLPIFRKKLFATNIKKIPSGPFGPLGIFFWPLIPNLFCVRHFALIKIPGVLRKNSRISFWRGEPWKKYCPY